MSAIVGAIAPDFSLKNQNGNETSLQSLLEKGPLLLVFYPGDFTPVCTKQLCNYNDNMGLFGRFGLHIVGVSANSEEEHLAFKNKYGFGFDLLTDPANSIAKEYGCTSFLMLGGISRAVFVIGKNKILQYRYVEPTVLSRRKANELIEIVQELKTKSLI